MHVDIVYIIPFAFVIEKVLSVRIRPMLQMPWFFASPGHK